MASVTLDRCWIHLFDDPATYLRFYTSDRTDDRALDGTVRHYAAGRRRIVLSARATRTIGLTLRQVTDIDLATLDEWRGERLLLRDHRGRLVTGTFFAMSVSDYSDLSGYDVAVVFEETPESISV